MSEEVAVMQLLRVPPMGKLVVQANRKRFQKMSDVADESTRRLILAAAGDLVNFVGGYQALVAADLAPRLVEQPIADSTSSGPSESLDKKQTDFLARLERERDALKTDSRPREPSVLGGLRRMPSHVSVESVEEDSELNIVDQIDAILQEFVSADPHLVDRSIHLDQDPSGGLRIEVDGRYYQRPAEIKEPKIQIYIKKALKKWESE